MQRDVVSVEANLLSKRARQRTERRVTIKEEPSTSFVDAKIDSLVRTMERMMEILDIIDRTPPRENQPGPQIRNPNFRTNQLQIRQREPREQRGPNQHIRPHFQENYDDEREETIEGIDDVHINLMGINDNDSIFLTQEEHDLFLLSHTEIDEEESDHQAFENSIIEVHRQYNLRSKKSNDNPTKKPPDFRKTADTPAKKVYDSPPKKNSEVPTKRTSDFFSKTAQTNVPSTNQPKDTSQKNVVEKSDFSNQNKTQTSSNLESELAKLKIPIPLTELMNTNAYGSQVKKSLNI
jgi:hypothetical protein